MYILLLMSISNCWNKMLLEAESLLAVSDPIIGDNTHCMMQQWMILFKAEN